MWRILRTRLRRHPRLRFAVGPPPLLLFFFFLGCGKTPDSALSTGSGGSGTGSAGAGGAGSGASAAGSGAADGRASAFACTAEAPAGDMVPVAAGDFPMGCEEKTDPACTAAESPLHTVSLGAFEIDRTEVTQAEYTACIQTGDCAPPACDWDCDNTAFPAACVTWAQATAYCDFAGKRLPTEAEWEKAARGSDGRKYPWGNQEPDCSLVDMAGCGDRPEAVGSHPSGASPSGALDMAGNVVELVADFYDATYYQSSPTSNPPGPATGTRYVGRGGGYASTAAWQRASSRDWYDATDASRSMGFRCAR